MNPETPKLPPINIDGVWLPKANSTLAPDVDVAWDAILIISVIMFFMVIGAVAYFAVKYKRRTETDMTSDIDHAPRLELVWTVIPSIIVIALFFVGLKGYVAASVPPSDAYEISVSAQKWSWAFIYPNGAVSPDLVVPAGKPVKLLMSSKDVIHSLFIPEFRVKQDVPPGLYTTLWFEANEPGDTVIECTEYCGTDHSRMLAKVTIVPEAAFKVWLENAAGADDLPPAELGAKIFAARGCNGCHTTNGAPLVGPTFKGLFGRPETLSDGSVVTADENYIRESILESQAKLVRGFPSNMPSFQGLLNDKQVTGLIEYIKTLK
jgi:cytochrome c oxidase subunit II